MSDAPITQTEGAPPRKRGLFQIHLSTTIVLMFVAAGLVWFELRGSQPIASPWISVQSLSVRTVAERGRVPCGDGCNVKLELRNDADEPMALFRRFSPDEFYERPILNWTDRHVELGRRWHGVDPTDANEYTVVRSGDILQHHYVIKMPDDSITVRIGYVVSAEPARVVKDANGQLVSADKLLGARVWEGEVVSLPLKIEFIPEWTFGRVSVVVLRNLAILAVIGALIERIIRRRETTSFAPAQRAGRK